MSRNVKLSHSKIYTNDACVALNSVWGEEEEEKEEEKAQSKLHFTVLRFTVT
jgi:hypothetical protein